ncbi:MAG: DUF2075 domain-containing protein [Cytophagales bacterium]
MFNHLQSNHYAKDLWPIVYILSDQKIKEAYVGETTDTYARMSNHLKSKTKKKLTSVNLIGSDKFNKSATLDIESNLIKYLSGDGQFQLLNGNLGLANHNYYQKNEIYWDVFKSIWDELRSRGIARHSINHIDNSDLFKYSPFKSLTDDQKEGLKEILNCILEDGIKNAIVEGGAGTGKTILAVFVFKLLVTDNEDFNFQEFGDDESEFYELIKNIKQQYPNPKMGLIIPMASFRGTMKKVFKNIKGLKASMVISPAEVSRQKFDILLVDESHRLRKKKSIGAYIGAFNKAAERLNLDSNKTNELEWVILQSKKAILFYDEDQSVKPSDVTSEDFNKLKKTKNTAIRKLKSQFRVRGGNAYVSYIDKLLKCQLTEDSPKFDSKHYEFLIFDSAKKMMEEIKSRNEESGLSRLIAGFSWDWVSSTKETRHLNDIKLEDVELKWNFITKDWINSDNAINEVGCIHTTQGYDLNYAGIIFGNEISYDKTKDEIIVIKDNYKDPTGRQAETPKDLKNYIINIYKTVMLRGIKGTYVYVCDPKLREYLSQFIPKFEAENFNDLKYLSFEEAEPFINSIPLYDLKVAAGEFGDIQNPEDVQWISIPENFKPSKDLFACQVVGESMNKIIPNGSICLFKKYQGGSRNGEIVLAEHTRFKDSEFGSHYTIKEYQSKKSAQDIGWEHESIILKPLSYDNDFDELVLENLEEDEFRVIGIFQKVLN